MMNRIIKRLTGAVLAAAMLCALVLPGLTARAEAPASYSAQLQLQADGQELSAKLWADSENRVFAAQGQITAEGQLLAQLGLFLGEEAVVVQDTLLLGDAYGIDRSRLAQTLPGSVFAPDSGSVLALPQLLYDALLGKSAQAEPDGSGVSIIGGADGPTAIMTTGALPAALLQAASIRTAPGELALESGTVKTTETTVTLEAAGMAKLAAAALADLQGEKTAMDVLAALPGFDSIAPEMLPDSQKLQAELEKALADARLTLSLAVDRQTKALLSCSVAWSRNGQSSTASLKVEENSGEAYALRFHREENGQALSLLTFRWEKQSGAYALSIQSGQQTDELTGTIEAGEDQLVITADCANGWALEDCRLTLRRDDPAQIPQFRDILTMSEDAILGLLQGALSAARELGQ